MNNVILSIIIPIYNLELYIDKCLNSITSQMTDEIEVILIDDGSKDKSKEICEKYCEINKQIRYYYQDNEGVSSARNNGLSKANGEYIYFVDGDDWILEDSISKIIAKIKENKDIDIIAGTFAKSFGKVLKSKSSNIIPNLVQYSFPENLIKLFKSNFINLSLWCNIFKRKLFTDNNIYLEKDVKYTEDIDCTLKLFLAAKKIDMIEQPIYVYRQNGNSATSVYKTKRVTDTMNFVIKWNKLINQEPKELRDCILNFIKYEYSIVVGMLFLLNKEDKRDLYDNIKSYSELLKNASGIKGKIVHCTYCFFGFNVTGRMMAFWIKNKSKLRR